MTESSASDSASSNVEAGLRGRSSVASRLRLKKLTISETQRTRTLTTDNSSPSEYFTLNSDSDGEKLFNKPKRSSKTVPAICETANDHNASVIETARPTRSSRSKRPSTGAVHGTVKRKACNKRVEHDVRLTSEMDTSAAVQLQPSCSTVQKCNKNCDVDPEDSPDENNNSTSSSEVEWEDVEDVHYCPVDYGDKPEKTIQVTVEQNTSKKKNGFDVKDAMRQLLNRYKKQLQENMHKTHLLCLLAHGQYRNQLCQDTLLLGSALSIVPPEFVAVQPDSWTLKTLDGFVSWFRRSFPVESQQPSSSNIYTDLLSRPAQHKVASLQEHVLLFVAVCRAVGLCTRLIYSLQPVPFKPTDLKLKKASGGAVAVQPASRRTEPSVSEENQDDASSNIARSRKCQPNGHNRGGARKVTRTSGEVLDGGPHSVREARPKRHCKQTVNYDESKLSASDEPAEHDSEQETVTVTTSQCHDVNQRMTETETAIVDSRFDDDFERETVTYRTPTSVSSNRKSTVRRKRHCNLHLVSKTDRFILSPDPTNGNWWTEVYLLTESHWISVRSSQGLVDSVEKIASEATQPLSYILSFDSDGVVKDITAKYSADWATSLKRSRLDEEWWCQVLEPFKPPASCVRNHSEDQHILETMLSKPLPSTIAEYKNHPLYVLQRHLLKFEAVYPTTAVPLGFVRGEPVYARECVHTLHAREKWLHEGRIVRISEEPYKIVRARPKFNKPKEYNDALTLNLFGHWQTEEYVAPPAVDGKVPVNEYGNVEVFRPWMLPKGTVHIRDMPGLNKVARKLNVDCAAAMVGWDFHGGFNHPVFDGWVVCEEHRDSLTYAWQEEQAILQQKELDKKQQRVYENWVRLIKGVRIIQRLKQKFDVEEPSAKQKKTEHRTQLTRDILETVEREKTDADSSAYVTDTSLYWPRNRESAPAAETTDSSSLFPFEKQPR